MHSDTYYQKTIFLFRILLLINNITQHAEYQILIRGSFLLRIDIVAVASLPYICELKYCKKRKYT